MKQLNELNWLKSTHCTDTSLEPAITIAAIKSLELEEDNLGKHEKETFSLDGKELFHFYFSGESWKCTERYSCENIKLGSEWETLYNFSFKAPLWENLGILNWPGPVRVAGE